MNLAVRFFLWCARNREPLVIWQSRGAHPGEPVNDKPYLTRYYITPHVHRGFGFNFYLHHFQQSDDERAMHDHPRCTLGIILDGAYREWLPWDMKHPEALGATYKMRRAWIPVLRSPTWTHRVELLDNKPVWTLFITGPHVREWGFWCPKGWKHNREFESDGGCE